MPLQFLIDETYYPDNQVAVGIVGFPNEGILRTKHSDINAAEQYIKGVKFGLVKARQSIPNWTE